MVLVLVGAPLVLIAMISGVWYWLALRHNQRRALQVLRWIEVSLGTQGQATGISWIARSRFKVPLRLRCTLFHRAWMIVDLRPCDLPLSWLAGRISGAREVVTFHADLDVAPSFSLHVHNFRWCAQSSRKTAPAQAKAEQCGRFVISTRMDWQREISSAMASLSRSENHDFLDINFQRRSPHFSATLPLQALAPGSPVRTCVLESMREVAASASTSLS